MSHYRATNNQTAEVVEYDADVPQAEHLEAPWGVERIEDAYVAPDAPVDTRMFRGRRRVTKLEFVALLGDAAYGAILVMAKQSVMVEALVKMIELATPDADGTSISLDDARTQYGVQQLGGALQQAGAVADGAAWSAGVLNG